MGSKSQSRLKWLSTQVPEAVYLTPKSPPFLKYNILKSLGNTRQNKDVSINHCIRMQKEYLFLISNSDFNMFNLFLLLLLSRVSRVRICATPETAAHQASLSLGFSRQEYWSGLPFPSPMHECEKWKWSRSVVSDSSRPHGLQPTRLLCPWDFPSKSTGVGCHCLLC